MEKEMKTVYINNNKISHGIGGTENYRISKIILTRRRNEELRRRADRQVLKFLYLDLVYYKF